MASWWNIIWQSSKLTEQFKDEMESWQNCVLLECQVGEMFMKYQVDKAGEWLNTKLTKQQFNKTKKLTK
jgi:hypothetical protein